MGARSPALSWNRDGSDWPNGHYSRFVETTHGRWHVQMAGEGPVILLLHGTGASTHTWRDLFLPLARDHTVVAIDLPGHGFTVPLPPAQMGLKGMSAAIEALIVQLGMTVDAIVGHSAGAAIGAQLCLDHAIRPRALVSLSGALLAPEFVPISIFSSLARLMAASQLVPAVFAWRASDLAAVKRLVATTGSRLDEHGYELYRRLTSNSAHVGNVLTMLAAWDLTVLARALPRLDVPLTMVVAAGDRTVPPGEAGRVSRLLPAARVITVPALGHLAHEEKPEVYVELIQSIVGRATA